MPPVDCARWTTTLTASYLAITAALIAILGSTVPGRVWLVAAHLTLSASLLILNRVRPQAGILRVIRDWHPLMLFPLLYKEVELLAPAIGDWRLSAAIPAWESALFAGQPSLYLSERLAFVPLSEFLHFSYLSYVIVIPTVLRLLVHQRTTGGVRRTGADAFDRAAGELLVLHPAAGGQPVLLVAAPGPAALRPLLLRSRSPGVRARRRARGRISQRARVGCGCRDPGRVATPAPARVPARPDQRGTALRHRVRPLPLRPRHARRRSPGDRRRDRVSILLRRRCAWCFDGRVRSSPTPAACLSHTAIVAREFGLPAVVATANATSSPVDGEEVTVDGTRGEVTRC